jgi:hypothetical protein
MRVLAAICLAFCVTPAFAAEPPPKKPAVKDLQALIGASPRSAPKPLAELARGDTWRVNHYIGETEKGVVVAIGVATTTFSAEEVDAEKDNWDGYEGTYATEQHMPVVFLFQRQPDASLVPVGGLRLPTAEAPHAEFGWGFSKLDDFDGDGRPELAVVYGYRTYHPGSTYGEGKRKEITWLSVNDTRVTVQANLLTEELLGDLTTPEAKITYRLVPQEGTAFKDLRVTHESRDGTKKSALWTYDPAKDLWTPPAK